MSNSVSRDEIRNARRADLYRFLLDNHGESVEKVGKYLTLKDHSSMMIQKGYPGYVHNSVNESGNPIDFLVRYMGYSFTEAVRALNAAPQGSQPLTGTSTVPEGHADVPAAIAQDFPQSCPKPYKRAYAYLTQTRKLSHEVVNKLMDLGLIYQDTYGNVVFINRGKSYCEIRGTLSNVRFHRAVKASGIRPYWYFWIGKGRSAAYICESAIDAISLYEIHRSDGQLSPGTMYCSIGGVGKQYAIYDISGSGYERIILAVDNDDAGDICRARNGQLEHLVPMGKDWNEDLARRRAGEDTGPSEMNHV